LVDGNGGYSSSLEPFVGGDTTILVLLYLQNPSLPPLGLLLSWDFFLLLLSALQFWIICIFSL
jgi:hypothetical protein